MEGKGTERENLGYANDRCLVPASAHYVPSFPSCGGVTNVARLDFPFVDQVCLFVHVLVCLSACTNQGKGESVPVWVCLSD